jgi:hypothetical protein
MKLKNKNVILLPKKKGFTLFVALFICTIAYGQLPAGNSVINKADATTPFEITFTQDPAGDFVAVQLKGLNRDNMDLILYDAGRKPVRQSILYQGSTIAYFDTRTLYSGEYTMWMKRGTDTLEKKITIVKQ